MQRTRFLVLFLLLLFGCALTAGAQIADNSGADLGREISGFVRSSSNQPIPGVTVYLQSDIGEIIQQISPEGSGRFQFQYLAKAYYYVGAKAPGYREVRQRADLVMQRRYTMQIQLVPDTPVGSAATAPTGIIDPKYLQIPEAARKEFEKASGLLREKKPQESVTSFRKAIELHEGFAAAHLLLGTAYMDLRQWKDARGELEKAVTLDDKQAAAHLALGACLANLGEFGGAEKSLRRGLTLNPETADGQLELGKVLLALGRWPEAEAPARKALQLRADSPMAHLLLGNILLKKNERKSALEEFQAYLKLEPAGPFAPRAREVVASLEKASAAKP